MSLPRSTRRRLVLLAKVAIVALLVWAVSGTLLEASRQLRQYAWELKPGWLILSGVIYILALLPAGWFWHRALRALGQDAGIAETLRAYFIGHLGKYVPGKAMVIVLRAGLIQSHRVSPSLAAASVFLETMTMMAVGAFLSAAILGAVFREQLVLLGLSVALVVAAGLPTLPPIFRLMARGVGIGRSDPVVRARLEGLQFRTLALGWGCMFVCWLLMGLSLWATVRGMGVAEADALRHLPLFVASVALAVVAGFLSLISGGLGVREMIIMQLLVPYFGQTIHLSNAQSAALLSALLLRIVWLLAELLVSGVLYVGVRRRVLPRVEGDCPPPNGS